MKASISRAVDSSQSLRSKKDLIERFIQSVNIAADVEESWVNFLREQRAIELEQLIEDENLDPAATHTFVDQSFKSGSIQTFGTGLARLLPAVSIFSPSGEHEAQRGRVIDKLQNYFERFFNLS